MAYSSYKVTRSGPSTETIADWSLKYNNLIDALDLLEARVKLLEQEQVNDCSHSQSVDTPAMTVKYALSPVERSHAQSVDTPAMTVKYALSPVERSHAQSVDTPAGSV